MRQGLKGERNTEQENAKGSLDALWKSSGTTMTGHNAILKGCSSLSPFRAM